MTRMSEPQRTQRTQSWHLPAFLRLCVLCVLCGSLVGASSLQVIPQPQTVTATDTPFDAKLAKFITVSDNASDRLSATLLQQALRETHGINCEIRLIPAKTATFHRVALTEKVDLPAADVATASSIQPAAESETYSLKIDAPGVIISADGDAGLFYGVQTLIQLLEQSQREKTALPAVSINDHPTFGLRCRYFDASQYAGTIVNTRANLEREIKLLARYKLNALVIDLYNLVPFKSFPYCADANTLSAGDWEYLVELAHQHHVTIIPSLQSFSQIYQVIWTCEEGKPYRESTAGGLICPSRPENVKFLQGLYKDLIATFKYTPILGVGCSEVGMSWNEKYCPLCKARIDKGETLQNIYSKHVRACVQAVESAAKELNRAVRPMMWADEFYMGYGGKRWTDIENIPKNTVMGHWMYWKPYDGIAGLMERGFDVLFLSATYQHNTYLIDLSPQDPVDGKWEALVNSGIRNIADQARDAAANTQKNLRGKLLGGGCATFSQHDIRSWDTTWFAFALQAEYAWGDPARSLDELLPTFSEKFAANFYGTRDVESGKVISSAYRDLDAVKSDIERNNYLIRDIIGVFDVQDKSYLDNKLEDSLKLIAALDDKTRDAIRQRCEKSIPMCDDYVAKLSALVGQVRNPTSLRYLVLSSHRMKNHVQRTLFLLDLAEQSRNPKDAAARETLQKTCRVLIDETQFIADEMDALTRAVRLNPDAPDSMGYHKVLTSFKAFDQQLRTP